MLLSMRNILKKNSVIQWNGMMLNLNRSGIVFMKLMDRGWVTRPRGEYLVKSTLKIGHFQNIAQIESLTPIWPGIWPPIKADYRVIFEYQQPVKIFFSKIWHITYRPFEFHSRANAPFFLLHTFFFSHR